MKKFRMSFILISLLSLFSFTGCFWQMGIFQAAKIDSVTGIGGPQKALVTWTYSVTFSSEITKISIEIYPANKNGESKFWTTSEKSSFLITGLDNDTNYSVKIQNYQEDGQFYSGSSCLVKPDALNFQTVDAHQISELSVKITKPFVEFKNVNGKYLSYANINPSTEKSVERSTSMQWGVTDLGAMITGSANSRSAAGSQEFDVSAIFDDDSNTTGPKGIRNYRAPDVDLEKINYKERQGARAGLSQEVQSAALNEPGSLVKASTGHKAYFYLDNDSEISKYVPKECYLRNKTVDSDGNSIFIWVEKSCWTELYASGKKVNQLLVDNLAKTFKKYAQVERKVYGDESNKIQIPYQTCAFEKMEDLSPTGNNVNIIIYDIGNDYGSSSSSGVLGYFHSKDYFQNSPDWGLNSGLETSNEGKFFYIDAPFCNFSRYNSTTKEYEFNGNPLSQPSGEIISTLFHEFQHMINYGNKTVKLSSGKEINKMVRSSAWYNEMLSMLCEDMLQESLGTTDEEAPRGGRLPTFNAYYSYSGIAEWSSSNTIVSYSTAYAFGSWLARNFGGTNFITEVSTNDSVDMQSILDAINAIEEVNGKSYTQEDLLAEFIKGICIAPENAEKYNSTSLNPILTMNCNGAGIVEVDGVEAVFSPINLYEKPCSTFTIEVESGVKKTKRGPVEFAPDYSSSIGPFGFIYHQIGNFQNASGASVVFDLTDNGDQLYVFVQDQFAHYLEDK